MKKTNRIALFNILSTVLLNGISLITSPLFSRLLGTNGYGIISIYLTWVSVMAIVFTLQTQHTIVNARVEYSEEEQKKYQSSIMTLSGGFFVICALIVFLLINQVSSLLQLQKAMVLLALFQSFGLFCVGFINFKFTYEFKAGSNFILSLGITLSTLFLSLWLIDIMPKATNYYGRIIAMSVIYGILGLGICSYILFSGKTFFNKKYWRFCLPLAIPILFQSLSDLLLGQSDRVMIQQLGTDTMVGQYSLASNFSGVISMIFIALNNSWSPFFYDTMKAKDREIVHRQAKNFYELFTVLAIGFVLLTTEVYHIFARYDFWEGTTIIPVLSVGYYFVFMSTFPVNYECYHKKTKVVAIATVTASIINIILNYFFIQKMGIMGAALATAISHGIQFVFHYLYARYRLGKKDYPFTIKLWLPYLTVFLSSVILALTTPKLWILRWPLAGILGLWELYRIFKRKTIF